MNIFVQIKFELLPQQMELWLLVETSLVLHVWLPLLLEVYLGTLQHQLVPLLSTVTSFWNRMRHSLLLPTPKIPMDNLLSSLLVAALPQLPSLMMIVCWLSYYIVSYVFAVCICYHFILLSVNYIILMVQPFISGSRYADKFTLRCIHKAFVLQSQKCKDLLG